MLFFCIAGFRNLYRNGGFRAETSTTSPLLKWVPILLLLAVISQSIGESFFIYYYEILHQLPFPSLEDAGYLSAYPSLLLAILLLSRRWLPAVERTRIFLDGLIVMTAVVTFSWYFILGPTVLQEDANLFTKIVASAYPLGDLVLISCLIMLSSRMRDTALRSVTLILSLGLAANVFADISYSFRVQQGASTIGGVTDVGWLLGYMLYGLGAQVLLSILVRQPSNDERTQSLSPDISQGWLSLLPYALVPAVILLFIYTQYNKINNSLTWGVALGGITLILLILLRQFFAVRETIYYNKQLRLAQRELHTKNQALHEANKQLEAQAKQVEVAYEQERHLNELKDQFLLNVNHELRTPLTEIHGYLDLLNEYKGRIDDTMQTTFIRHAVHGCDELLRLVNNVLDAIRGDIARKVPQFEVLSIAEVVYEVLEIFGTQKRQEYSITIDIPKGLTVRADQQYLHQILLNLLSNAFKYSPPHTAIVLSAGTVSTETSGDPANQQVDPSSSVCISVQDAGPGIPPLDIPLLFGKFVRLKRDLLGPVRGTGLGLYISRQFVEAMGGRIWVESSGIAGQGSRFCFTLPAAYPVANAEEPI